MPTRVEDEPAAAWTYDEFLANVIIDSSACLERRFHRMEHVPTPELDVDALLVEGNRSIVPILMGSYIKIGHQQAREGDFKELTCLLCTGPMELWVHPGEKAGIIEYLAGKRGHPCTPSASDNVVFKGGKHLTDDDFMAMLCSRGIDKVGIKCYGMKGTVHWAYKMWTKLRDADPECDIRCDFGLEVDPIDIGALRGDHCNQARRQAAVPLLSIKDSRGLKDCFGECAEAYTFLRYHLTQMFAATEDDHITAPTYGNVRIKTCDLRSMRSMEMVENEKPMVMHVNCYGSDHHAVKELHKSVFSRASTGRTAKSRLKNMEEVADMLINMRPKCRMEVRFRLREGSVPTLNDMSDTSDYLDHVWRSLFVVWNSLDVICVPVGTIVRDMDRIIDYAKSSAVPTPIRCFNIRVSDTLVHQQKGFFDLIMPMLGVASKRSSKKYRGELMSKSCLEKPFQWVAYEIALKSKLQSVKDRQGGVFDEAEFVEAVLPAMRAFDDSFPIHLEGCKRFEMLNEIYYEWMSPVSKMTKLEEAVNEELPNPWWNGLYRNEEVEDAITARFSEDVDAWAGGPTFATSDAFLQKLSDCLDIERDSMGRWRCVDRGGHLVTHSNTYQRTLETVRDRIVSGNYFYKRHNWRSRLKCFSHAQKNDRRISDDPNKDDSDDNHGHGFGGSLGEYDAQEEPENEDASARGRKRKWEDLPLEEKRRLQKIAARMWKKRRWNWRTHPQDPEDSENEDASTGGNTPEQEFLLV